MKMILCAICVSLMVAGAAQAQQSITLDLPAGGPDPHPDGSVFATSVTDGGGATYDIEYTLNAFATDETVVDAFIKANAGGTFFGVGSAPDGANTAQQESVDGGDGERLSITNLSITNFVPGDDGLTASDLSIAFSSITIANGPNVQDGINFSFADFDVDTANVTRPGFVNPDTGVAAQPAEVDLTALANFDAASTSVFLAPDNVAGSNRWSVAAIVVDVTGGTSDGVLLGDVDLSGEVDFSDIAPFIEVLSSNGSQAEADVDQSGTVDFGDIGPFIQILSGS